MMLVSTLETNNYIGMAARRDQAETSKAIKPKSEPKIWTVVPRILVMRAGVTDKVMDPVTVYTQFNGVEKGTLSDHNWHTWCFIAVTVQM